jgi:hypothetical protein
MSRTLYNEALVIIITVYLFNILGSFLILFASALKTELLLLHILVVNFSYNQSAIVFVGATTIDLYFE